jgi:hypothetical protein
MCSDRHLTALAAYAVRHGLSGVVLAPDRGQLEAIAKVFGMLARENIASLDARYPGDTDSDAIGTVQPRVLLERFDPIHIIKACHCYAYQACEHPGWDGSRAKQIVASIEAHAVRNLPGYSDAPWGL